MPVLQELDGGQITSLLHEATARHVPLAVCACRDGRWLGLRSRFIAPKDNRILIEMPVDEKGACPYEFVPAEKIGISFKLKHHKHTCAATVGGVEQFELSDGTAVPVLSICWPAHMNRLQRRSYLRVDVPANRILRVSFWLGGRSAEPTGGSSEAPVWSGTAANISAGGVHVRCRPEAAAVLDVGDVVGMRLLFGLGGESIHTDAQFRRLEQTGGEVFLGFQFLGLGQTRQGVQALRVLSAKVAELQHAASREHQRDKAAW
jgi:c-di-GMP-binding flagellar brake protein YcgR